ncbi:tetratricopeptide repeat protein [Mangrovibacterium lignilyticum]|uniref:tetratricopeptide repeat protein n=1 Tax=Mangrovibacterium lignilyticum TaxID=2668052 RepID=UPI0013D4C152|nr:tetratricopeptide repeat protein [Mangrovibacterium lignilyticum]
MKRILLGVVFLLGTVTGFAQDAAELINQGNDALTAKEYAKAFQLYDSAMKNLGDVQVDDAINFNIGFAAFQADKYEDAVKYFDKAIAADANTAAAKEYKANALAKLDKTDEAIAAYKDAITVAEDPGSLNYNAGIVAYKGKKYAAAAEFFAAADAAGYNSENAIYYKAMALRKLDKDDEYKATLVAGAEKFPSNDKITGALANVYVSEGNVSYKKGVKILNAANAQVQAGTMKTTDEAYTKAVADSKVEFQAAYDVLQKAIALDATNANAKKLIDACKTVL